MNESPDNQNQESVPESPSESKPVKSSFLSSVKEFFIHLSPAGHGLIMLGILMLIAILSLAPGFPLKVTPASASPDQFSGERAMAHLLIVAKEPHPEGSPAQARVRDYLLQQLSGRGLEVQVQQAPNAENVVARLHGTEPTGAIVVLAHYDSLPTGPGAADNGSGVVTLLEVTNALAAGPTPRNDVIILFDDSEELPDALTGTKAFVRWHPWMPDVRVAIGLDTAVKGFIATDDTGTENGWLVKALRRAYTGGEWSSLSGGGRYDSSPFKDVGIQVLELEDNYPFSEQHTAQDVPAIVNPGSIQQMGDQTLAVIRELGDLELSQTKGPQELYFSVPVLGLVHYRETWAIPLAIIAMLLLITALGLALWRKFTSWLGLLIALGIILITTVLAVLIISLIWKFVPDLMGWDPNLWPEWPQVIPPNGGYVALVFGLLTLVLVIGVYLLARRKVSRIDFSLAGLILFVIISIVLAIAIPRASHVPVWSVLIGSLSWIIAVAAGKQYMSWSVDLAATLTAIPLVVLLWPLIPGVVMSDGMNSLAIVAGVGVLLLFEIFPAIDGLLIHTSAKKKLTQDVSAV